MDTILNQLSPMKNGKELLEELAILPPYNPKIREQASTVRLMALSDLYSLYIPSSMSVEIYSKLYLALLRSLHKKEGISAQVQRNENHKRILQRESNNVLGGSDSFTIIGTSGIGKSTAINRAIELITEKGILENSHIVVMDTLVQKHIHSHKHTVTHKHDGATHSHTIEHSHEHSHYLSDKNHKHYHKTMD